MTVHPFRFGACEVRPVTRELIRDGKLADIQPRAFDLLVYLVENPGRVVGKDELLDHVWGQRVVSESVVARTVMKARKAIGDDASEPHFILTHHGHGYRFVGELVETAALPEGAVTIALSSPDFERMDAEVGLAADSSSRAKDRALTLEWLRSRRIPGRWFAAAGVAALAIGAAFLVPERVEPEAPSRAVVLPIVNATERDALGWTRLGLMGVLRNSLGRTGQVELVSPGELTSAMNAIGVRVGTVLAEEDRTALARQLGAGIMVQGRLRQAEGEFQLDFDVFGPDRDEKETTLSGKDPVVLAVRAGSRVAELQAIPRRGANAGEPAARTPYINETYARAMDAMARKRFVEATRLLEVVVNAGDDQLQPKLDLAKASLQARQTRRALAIATEVGAAALAKGDNRVRAASLLIKSRALYKLDDLVDAESSARQALALASLDYPGIEPDAKLQLGILAYQQFRQEEAKPLIHAAISDYRRLGSDYRLAGAHLQLGETMRWLDVPAAVQHYSRALELARRSGRRLVQVTALTKLADTSRVSGRCSQALDQLDQVLLLARQLESPHALAQVYLARGRCEQQIGRTELAIGSMRKAVELAESAGELELLAATLLDYASALAQKLGVDPAGTERLRRAAESYEKHEQLGPAVGALLNFVQQLIRQTDRYDELEPLQRRIEFLSRDVDDPAITAGAIVLRAMLAYRQDRFPDAMRALEQARAAAGKSTSVWVDSSAALLWLYLELGQTTEAEAVARSMTTIMTGYPTLCIARARLFYEKKQFSAALKKQEACLAEFGSSMKNVDRAYRDSYAAAAMSGKRAPLPEVTPFILWL